MAGTPLTLDAADANGPAFKADGGFGRAAIETDGGDTFAVGYSVDGHSVVWVILKAADGTVVTIHFAPGVAHDQALAFASRLE